MFVLFSHARAQSSNIAMLLIVTIGMELLIPVVQQSLFVAYSQTTSYMTVPVLILALSRRRCLVYGRCLRGQKVCRLEQPRWLEGVRVFREAGVISIRDLDGADSWPSNFCRLLERLISGCYLCRDYGCAMCKHMFQQRLFRVRQSLDQ